MHSLTADLGTPTYLYIQGICTMAAMAWAQKKATGNNKKPTPFHASKESSQKCGNPQAILHFSG